MGCFGDDPQPASNTTVIQAPAPRDYAQETSDTLRTKIDLAPEQYAAESEFAPKYAELQNKILQDTMLGTPSQQGLLDLYRQAYPQISALEAGSATAQRTADIGDVEALGPRAQAAFRAANPQLTALLDSLSTEAMGAGASDIETEMKRQAMTELGLGSSLSADEERAASQKARQIWGDRGLSVGKPAAAAEILSRYDAGQNRLNQRRAFAQGVDMYSNEREGMDRSFKGNVATLTAANTRDPFLAILGRPSNTAAIANADFTNAGFTQNAAPRLFNPESAYAADIYDTNYNGAAATNIANANLSAALYGADQARAGAETAGMYGMVGSIVGGALGGVGSIAGMCWVAREVYGIDNPKWMLFREWMLTKAPVWFRDLYLQCGERFARFIRNKPLLKSVIRKWMDSKIERKAYAV